MPLDFPASPSNGATYTGPNGVVWIWDGTKWTVGTQSGAYLPLSGGTLSGSLTIAPAVGAGSLVIAPATGSDPLHINVTAGNYARARFTNPTRTWSIGTAASGEFMVADETGVVVKFSIPPTAAATLAAPLILGGGLSVGGNTLPQLTVESGMTLLTAPAGSGHGSIYLQSDTDNQYRAGTHLFQSQNGAQQYLSLSGSGVISVAPTGDVGYGIGGTQVQYSLGRDRTATGYSILNLHSLPGVSAAPSARLLVTPTAGDIHIQEMVAGGKIYLETEGGTYSAQILQGGDTALYGRLSVGTANGFVGGGGGINASAYYLAGVPHLAMRGEVAALLADGASLPLTDWEAEPSEDETCLGLLVNRGGELSLQPVVLGPEDSGGPGLRALAVYANGAAGRTGPAPKPGPTRDLSYWDHPDFSKIEPLPKPDFPRSPNATS